MHEPFIRKAELYNKCAGGVPPGKFIVEYYEGDTYQGCTLYFEEAIARHEAEQWRLKDSWNSASLYAIETAGVLIKIFQNPEHAMR